MKPYLLLFAIAYSYCCNANCMLSKLSIDSRTKNSGSIIEGEVIKQSFCWNTDKSSIFTINTIEVSKILKGSASATIDVITPGGEIDGKLLVVEPNASLSVGSKGVFFLMPSIKSLNYSSNYPKYEIFGLAQGFIQLDERTGIYSDPFEDYASKNNVYSAIQKTTGINYRETAPLINNIETGEASISLFTPASISAGTQSVLTISGWGFGSRTGSATVQFRDANSTSSAIYTNIPDTSYILSWTDTEIKVIVPGASINRQGGAGSGAFNVITANGTAISSIAPLSITYNKFEYKKNKIALYNQNGQGGYTFTLNTDFDNNALAKAAFLKGLNQWKCNTSVNIAINPTSSSNACNNQMDNINLISFSTPACPLPAGALAVTYSSYTLCGNSPIIPDGIDMIFSAGANYYFGSDVTPPNQYDFESVVLHELGHAFGQGHHSEYTEIMFPSIANGVMKRTLKETSDIASVNETIDLSTATSYCGFQKHVRANTSNCNTNTQIAPISSQFIADRTTGCAPFTVKFTDQSTGNPTSWRWDINNNGSTEYTTQNPSHTFTSAGTYTIKMVALNTTSRDSIIKTSVITVSPALAANIDVVQAITCNGNNNAILKVTPSGGNGNYTYQWNNNNTNQTISNISAGTYTVTLKDGNNCIVTKSKDITQPEKIKVNVNTELVNNNYTATLDVSGGTQPYMYILNNATQFANNIIPNLSAGNYNVVVKDNNNCIQSASFSVEATTGIIEAEQSFDNLDIFPNPATNNINIHFSLKEYKSIKLSLMDLSGQTIFQENYNDIKDKQANLDLSSLSSGTYIIRLELPEGNTFRKIIISR